MQFLSRQPAFDGEFAALIAAIAVLVTAAVYGISHYRAKTRHARLQTTVRAFNALRNADAKHGHAAMAQHHIVPSNSGRSRRHVDFFMRLDVSGMPRDVYAAAGRPPPRTCEKMYMELLILDTHDVRIESSKDFVFYYINASWKESMAVFFASYKTCLMYHRLCDSWDDLYFDVLAAGFSGPEETAFARQYALLRRPES